MSSVVATALRVAGVALVTSTICLCAVPNPSAAADDDAQPPTQPVLSDSGLELTLIATHPQIVTPVGITVDAHGRLFVVESHTHFRPPTYQGPPGDRVLMFEDRDKDGTFETRQVFAEGFTSAMNLALGPQGQILLLERDKLTALWDTNNDGKADRTEVLLRVETESLYPHNGLIGLVVGPNAELFVGMGENLGKPYTVIGSDKREFKGGGDGGHVFRCQPDGSRLQLYATGFWNPTGLAFHGTNNLFAVDDDPETRPPNRLLDVNPGADYGFRYRYGAAADHPFVAWTGELPGTLGMMGPVGEGASGILSTATLNWPSTFRNTVLVTSWSDRRIELHTLRPQGASFQAKIRILVQGDNTFRPVAMAAGPSGEVYFTDWVKRDYSVHGHGRIWRLAPRKPKRAAKPPALPAANAARRTLQSLNSITAAATPAQARMIQTALTGRDPFLQNAATNALAQEPGLGSALKFLGHRDPRLRLGGLLAVKQAEFFANAAPANIGAIVRTALADPDLRVRMAAIVWGTDRDLLTSKDADLLATAARTKPVTPRLLHAYRAAAALLAIKPTDDLAAPANEALLQRLKTTARTPEQERAQRAAIWHLAQHAPDAAFDSLLGLAQDKRHNTQVRCDAIGALAMHGKVAALLPLLNDASALIQTEAVRALRVGMGDSGVVEALTVKLKQLARARSPRALQLREELRFALQDDSVPAPMRPEDQQSWKRALAAGKGDPNAGRRAFVNPAMGCVRCHRVADLGQNLGPPLTYMAGELPDRLLESLIDPSVDVVWGAQVIETKDGASFVGMVKSSQSDGTLIVMNAAGQQIPIAAQDIVSQTKSDASLMPDGLLEALTVKGVRDLFAYLRNANSMFPFVEEDRPLPSR